jgi:Uma2 family endonuclease
MPVMITPDWVCEIVSPSNATHDTIKKLRLYHRVAIPHYWLVDPRDETLTVMRWSEAGYVKLMRTARGEVVRPEPFEMIELAVGTLFGADPP